MELCQADMSDPETILQLYLSFPTRSAKVGYIALYFPALLRKS